LDIQLAIEAMIQRRSLTGHEMSQVMTQIMTGQATDAQLAGFLVGMRMKGETVEELTAAAQVMRDLAVKVSCQSDDLIDTCGTGGDGASLFNVSTTVAFVAAAAGVRVAKHGNRSASSTSGSSNVLEAAGVKLDISPEHVARCIDTIGVGFLFAPKYHGAMKYAAKPRKELGVRTFFNLLGPLVNPALVKRQVIGVFDRNWLEPIAQVLSKLGSEHVMVVHSHDGLDEISIAAPTAVAELKSGVISTYDIEPEQFELQHASLSGCQVSDAQDSLSLMRSALQNKPGPALDLVLMNAGAAIYVSGVANTLSAGIEMARDSVSSGLAHEKLKELVQFTQLPYSE